MEENEKVVELEGKVSKLKKKVKEAKELKPTRGIETMFRCMTEDCLGFEHREDSVARCF